MRGYKSGRSYGRFFRYKELPAQRYTFAIIKMYFCYRKETMDTNELKNKRIVVGLSGGVDSAVAAYLLKQSGATVIGMTMINCDAVADGAEDAKRIASFLDIEHIISDERDLFLHEVEEYFADEYLNGRTPNPCVVCNRKVKWDSLIRAMESVHADYIATGHYAGLRLLENGRYTLKRNPGPKDQTYAMCMLTQQQLGRTLMPLEGMNKDDVRRIANEAGLPVASKPDSQDICFVPDKDYVSVIAKLRPESVTLAEGSGNFVDEKGNILGRHKGITQYTVGQRKGLGLSLNKPVFVKKIRPATGEVVVSTEGDVYSSSLFCDNLNPIATERFIDGERLTAKVRYAGDVTHCTVHYDAASEEQNKKPTLRVDFDVPVRAVTPGQACVFYKDDCLYGGAIIL